VKKLDISSVITLIATSTLSLILVAMVGALLFGLFDQQVDNAKIFEMLMPAFQTIVGGFIGLITGIKLGGNGGTNCDKGK
jgi:H+/gluconate symporter-like permease